MKMTTMIGQFIPGRSVLHRLDVRFKLVQTLCLVVILLMAKTYVAYGLMTIFVAACVLMSGVPIKMLVRSLKPLWLILSFTLIYNFFFIREGTLLWGWRFITITDQGLQSGIFLTLRFVLLIIGTSLLTFTTSPIALTDGLESLMSPLKKLRFPAHELAMMMSIALRMIPTLMEEAERIIKAQQARGADFETGNIMRRAKALIPVLVPLFVSAFRRAEDLALAMESRCYHGGEGRTRMKIYRAGWIDLVACVLMAGLTAGMIWL